MLLYNVHVHVHVHRWWYRYRKGKNMLRYFLGRTMPLQSNIELSNAEVAMNATDLFIYPKIVQKTFRWALLLAFRAGISAKHRNELKMKSSLKMIYRSAFWAGVPNKSYLL